MLANRLQPDHKWQSCQFQRLSPIPMASPTRYPALVAETPPHPLDPEFAIHPPMSPREIHRRQQVLRGRRLTALFCIVSLLVITLLSRALNVYIQPEIHHIIRSGWVAARLEEKRKEDSMSTLTEDSKDNGIVPSKSGDN
ncbi:hypothetical protein H0H92_008739 [Tricholoma furcatifolium]|nr:hypothetical protein H0H92_008739 [Tricholoma furcatifolium]